MTTLGLAVLAAVLQSPAKAGESEKAWALGAGFGSLPAPTSVFWPPTASIFQEGGDRTPPPMIQPGKPAPVLKDAPVTTASPLVRLDLTALHNRLWRTGLTFELAGKTFHVSAQESHEGHYFIVTHNPGGKTFFLRDTTLALSSLTITVDGKTAKLTVNPDLTDLWGSHLVVQDVDSGKRWSWEMREITKAMYLSGEPVTLSGRSFRVHYTDQAYENGSNCVTKVGQPLLVLMAEQAKYKSEKYKYMGDAIEADPIPVSPDSSKVLVGSFIVPPYGTFAHAFRKTDGGKTLEVYPAP